MDRAPIGLPRDLPRFSEAQWLRDGSLPELLAFVKIECRPGRRKQGLLIHGLCQLARDHLPEGICRAAAELGEHLAEGRHSGLERAMARSELEAHMGRPTALNDPARAAWIRLLYKCLEEPTNSHPQYVAGVHPDNAAVRGLLHDLFGNPFRPVKVDPAWLRRNDGLVAKMVRVIEQEGRFEDLPILADALEDAGCTDPEILAHCRSAGPHVPGCWVLDRLRLVS